MSKIIIFCLYTTFTNCVTCCENAPEILVQSIFSDLICLLEKWPVLCGIITVVGQYGSVPQHISY